MYRDLREVYWLNGMKKDITGFVAKCPNCQQVKVEHQRPGGLSQYIDIPTWKWEDVNIDFVVGLPHTRRQHDSIWVIFDRMTKSAHFTPVKTSFSAEDYAKLYIYEIVKLHGVPSRAWYQSDGQAECTIQTIEDMLRAYVIDFKGSWDDHLPLIEFSYNNSYHSSIAMAPFKALYGRRCRSPVCWFEVGEFALIGPKLVYEAIEKISPMKGVMSFSKKGKLSPRYVAPYQILKCIGKGACELDLPNELAPVHPVFHVSMLKKYIGDPLSIIPLEGLGVDESLSYEEVPVEILDRKVKKLRNKEVASVKVFWRNHLVEVLHGRPRPI
ncbi:hypothetical protein MTR67_031275 [Solanum verrucosum]|uniref:Uncharacterized protein n=1 Tax=Solanum verrucosum TaxID=315347 RepID=A0AAF0U258_SOLVR|nr:hypothetical protein MTR67_031275 [Solanum verrucosum]